jgi:hypothetical protein
LLDVDRQVGGGIVDRPNLVYEDVGHLPFHGILTADYVTTDFGLILGKFVNLLEVTDQPQLDELRASLVFGVSPNLDYPTAPFKWLGLVAILRLIPDPLVFFHRICDVFAVFFEHEGINLV